MNCSLCSRAIRPGELMDRREGKLIHKICPDARQERLRTTGPGPVPAITSRGTWRVLPRRDSNGDSVIPLRRGR